MSLLWSLLTLLSAVAGRADLKELISPHVRVLLPRGDFASAVARELPPPASWKRSLLGESGFSAQLPDGVVVDVQTDGSRVALFVLPAAGAGGRPASFRVDRFYRAEGEPDELDGDYVQEWTEEYPRQSELRRFSLTDRGLLVYPGGLRLGFVAGTYERGGERAVRLQCVHLSPRGHTFFTLDCAESAWSDHRGTAARLLLGLRPEARRG